MVMRDDPWSAALSIQQPGAQKPIARGCAETGNDEEGLVYP
jgi:hypothetical protein